MQASSIKKGETLIDTAMTTKTRCTPILAGCAPSPNPVLSILAGAEG